MKFVLSLKHWQLFLITFGIPFALYLVFFATMFATMMSQVGAPQSPAFPATMIAGGIIIGIAWLIAIVSSVTWNFNVATGLFKKLPPGTTLKIKRYYFAFFFPMIYVITIILLCLLFFVTVDKSEMQSNQPPAFVFWIFLIIPLHFFAAACVFYTMYFIAKCLKSVELQREAQIGEYVGEFVLTWFFMIGVWFIQPRINQIFSNKGDTITSGSPG